MATNINGSSLTHVEDAVNSLHVSDDDDESFVVLGKYLDDSDYEHCIDKDFPSTINTKVVTDLQQCIQKELDTLENAVTGTNQPIPRNVEQNIKTEKVDSSMSMVKIPEVLVLRSGTSSLSSISSTTPENLQNKIEQLIKEKEILQQTIIRNNDNMKEHYDTITQWKDKVQMVHESNKEKILKAKEISQTFKTDNMILKKQITEQLDVIDSLKQQIKLLEEELSQKDEKLQMMQLKQNESEKSIKMIMETQQNEMKSLTVEKIQIQDELTAAKQEVAYLQTKISNQSSLNTSLETKKIEELERIVAKLYVEKEFIEKENIGLKEKLKELEIEINSNIERKLIEKDEKIKELEQVCAKAVNENDNLRKEIVSVKENITSNTELELQIGNLIDVKEELQKQNEKLKDDRAKVEANAIQNEIQMKAHIDKLQNDLQSAFAKRVCNQEEFEQTRLQLMNAQAKIAHLEEQVSEQKNVIAQKERELVTKSDNYFALETQLDLYKSDFDAERVARENIQSEKDQLVNDIQQLQRRNQQLQEEIEMLRERGFVYVPTQNDGFSRPPPSAPSASGNGSNSFRCPMCKFGFRDYQSLENHVQRCLDLEQTLP